MENRDTKQNVFLKYKSIFSVLFLLISVIIIIIISECTLYLLKYDNAYTKMKRFSIDKADWWINDSILGPRYAQNKFENLDKSVPDWYYERLKIVNKQGYHDKDDFIDLPSDTNCIKFLFIGDSFTWGASSDIDSSFVDVFEQRFGKNIPLIAWNAGIPATGTNYALHVTKRFLPLQKSDIVVLGFYRNDFGDNLIPFDRLQFNNKASCFNCYELDNSFNAIKVSIRDRYKDATGAYPIDDLNFFQREIIIKSRLIPLLNSVFERIKQKSYQYTHSENISKKEFSFKITKSYLNQLKNYVKENDAELIVLLIPARQDINRNSEEYLKAIEILRESEINYLEISDKFSQANYMQSESDGHWNNSGHRIAGTLLYEYILETFKLENFQ